MGEQSGFKAGDGGFQVNVGGDTTLIGGAIASNQSAVEEDKNSFSTGGTLTTVDIENKADYKASSTSVSVGGGADGKNKGISGVGVGVGRDSGSAASVTTAGISGIAGDTAMQTISSQMEAASDTKDARMQGLAGRERDAGGDANIVAAQTASCASHFLPARSGWRRSLL